MMSGALHARSFRNFLQTILHRVDPTFSKVSLDLAQALFSVLEVFDGSSALRRAVTDPSRDQKDKAHLLHSLFAGSISSQAHDALTLLVAERWSNPTAFCEALERLAAMAAIVTAENEQAEQGLASLEQELFAFEHFLEDHRDMGLTLSSDNFPKNARLALVRSVLPQHMSAAGVLLASQAAVCPRGKKPEDLVRDFTVLVAQRRRRWIARVETSIALDHRMLERLAQDISALYGRMLSLDVRVDRTLIGGLRVSVEDEVVDASVLTRLRDLRTQWLG